MANSVPEPAANAAYADGEPPTWDKGSRGTSAAQYDRCNRSVSVVLCDSEPSPPTAPKRCIFSVATDFVAQGSLHAC